MVELIEIPASHVVGARIHDKITRDDMVGLMEAITAAFQENTYVNVYVEMEKFHGMSFGALMEDMKIAIPKLHRFKKEAIVSDNESLRKWVKLGNALWFGGECRLFSSDEKDAAMEWVQEQ